MKKMTITVMATGVLLSAGTIAWAFGGGPGGPGGPMMRGPMMFGPGMGGPSIGQRIFEKADANKDGAITREEAMAAKGAVFSKFDTNNDGVVNSAEIDKGLDDKINRIRTRLRYMLLARLDANGDGAVSKDEFDKPGMSKFDRADANNDGKVTREEVQALGSRASRFMRHRGSRWFGRDHKRGPGGAW